VKAKRCPDNPLHGRAALYRVTLWTRADHCDRTRGWWKAIRPTQCPLTGLDQTLLASEVIGVRESRRQPFIFTRDCRSMASLIGLAKQGGDFRAASRMQRSKTYSSLTGRRLRFDRNPTGSDGNLGKNARPQRGFWSVSLLIAGFRCWLATSSNPGSSTGCHRWGRRRLLILLQPFGSGERAQSAARRVGDSRTVAGAVVIPDGPGGSQGKRRLRCA
jgi:hypothetical protein